MSPGDERSTLAQCVAQIVDVPVGEVPVDADELRAWLAGRGLGLVPIAAPKTFSWAGPWIARRPVQDGSGPRAVVMFGVPPGVLFEPVPTSEEVLDGFLVAPLDLARWPVAEPPDVGVGAVEAIVLAPQAADAVESVSAAEAIAGRGLRGDRYEGGRGTFASGRAGSALTLIEAEVLDELAAARGAPVDHRRNVVIRGAKLNALVGRRFLLGDEVVCEGRRLCEPCAHLERLNRGGVLRPLVHRGGLRADIAVGGTIRIGDSLRAL